MRIRWPYQTAGWFWLGIALFLVLLDYAKTNGATVFVCMILFVIANILSWTRDGGEIET